MDHVRISVMDYDKESCTEATFDNIEDAIQFTHTDSVTWINIEGLHDTSFIEKVGKHFSIHSLVLEDILNTGQRSKFESIEDYMFITLKMLDLEEGQNNVQQVWISSEQVSMIVKNNFLITFQEQTGDVFEPVRDRIRNNRGRIRYSGCDYLAYVLADGIVDNYIYLIEELGERVEDLELHILESPDDEVLEDINRYKRELNYLSKVIRPVRDTVINFTRTENESLKDQTKIYLRDLQDITIHSIESIDTYRELLNDYLNIYHTSVANRLNDIMRVLTIFSAIFIPLTFLAGIYGTNFEYFPELSYKYSYFMFLGVCLLIGISMILFFKRKKWL